jgi:tRNA G26 N,N-dimethylase Trm1
MKIEEILKKHLEEYHTKSIYYGNNATGRKFKAKVSAIKKVLKELKGEE